MARALAYQETPRCFGCGERVEERELVFAALCGHETCPSTCWHYHHLMQARETFERNADQQHGGERAIAVLLIQLRGDRDGGGEHC